MVEGPLHDDVPFATHPSVGDTVGFVGFEVGTDEGVRDGLVVGTSVGESDSNASERWSMRGAAQPIIDI